MKRLIIAILACLPLVSMAQNNVWEIPEDQQQLSKPKVKKEKKQKEQKVVQLQEDPKYMNGAVPLVDGRVVFTLDKDVPGLSAQEIYDKVYPVLEQIVNETKSADLTPPSRIAAVNKAGHTVAVTMNEWLVFTNSFIALDRTDMKYILVAHATDGHINVTMERINYAYEVGRNGSNDPGLQVKAEKWITDKEAITKNGAKLKSNNGKFRRKTIDRKNNIFGRICKALDIKYEYEEAADDTEKEK